MGQNEAGPDSKPPEMKTGSEAVYELVLVVLARRRLLTGPRAFSAERMVT